ncbi:hypothetical protein EDB92DRAFT_2100955 [Lactarius akahatsu]|uniref:F-box domain-containing protein n=1 Tax=Lactarius akahatsu TaxID=416441 RepID=A0AAD4LT95_9AGAM|nr:hypothetical protein EDB92DRAFT_2100955 [Lactarius akahatsu]
MTTQRLVMRVSSEIPTRAQLPFRWVQHPQHFKSKGLIIVELKVVNVTVPRQSGENSGPDVTHLAIKVGARKLKVLICQVHQAGRNSSRKAISLANDKSYVLYDSRASAYEKKNLPEDALRDAKKTIDIAPKQWHGYFRSARLFAALGQTNAALEMCSLALARLSGGPKHEAHRRELTSLCRHLEAPTKCPVSGTMPVELLLMIFQLSRSPIVISHVCHQWREIALSQPTLWRSLVLAAPAKKALRKVQEWYKRSCGQIEELVIRKSLATTIFPSSFDHRNPDDCAKYAELLARLRQLDLKQLKECHLEEVNAESFFSALSDNTRHDHQYSETLSISYMDPRPEYAELLWESLRAFSIINGGCDWARLSTSMCRLTSFEYKMERFISVFGNFHEFLQANPSLEKLVVEAGFIYPHQIPEAPASLTLAHLRHLELIGDTPFRIKRGNFSLPSLQILRMIKLRNGEVTLAELVEDEETSFAELVEFTARGCFLESQTLTSVLFQAPKLEILNCTGSAVNVLAESLTKPCMALLKDPASEDPTLVPTKLPILCPALSVLDLSQSDVKTDPIMRMVKERIALTGSQDGGRYQLPGENGDRGVSCIWSLNVDGCSRIEAEMLPRFRENVPIQIKEIAPLHVPRFTAGNYGSVFLTGALCATIIVNRRLTTYPSDK